MLPKNFGRATRSRLYLAMLSAFKVDDDDTGAESALCEAIAFNNPGEYSLCELFTAVEALQEALQSQPQPTCLVDAESLAVALGSEKMARSALTLCGCTYDARKRVWVSGPNASERITFKPDFLATYLRAWADRA